MGDWDKRNGWDNIITTNFYTKGDTKSKKEISNINIPDKKIIISYNYNITNIYQFIISQTGDNNSEFVVEGIEELYKMIEMIINDELS